MPSKYLDRLLTCPIQSPTQFLFFTEEKLDFQRDFKIKEKKKPIRLGESPILTDSEPCMGLILQSETLIEKEDKRCLDMGGIFMIEVYLNRSCGPLRQESGNSNCLIIVLSVAITLKQFRGTSRLTSRKKYSPAKEAQANAFQTNEDRHSTFTLCFGAVIDVLDLKEQKNLF